jgi:hypothetical protein
MAVPDEGQMTPSGRVIIGRRPMALRFALTLLALMVGAIVLAVVGQYVLSAIMLILFGLLGVGILYWSRDKR